MALATAPAAAATFHVDGSVAQSGDGRSWAEAWRSFADIDWQQLKPGDVLAISGGAAGRVYAAPLVVGSSGQAGKPITITAATDAAHGGPVTIDGAGNEPVCVRVDERDHVVVRGLTVSGCNESAIQLRNASGLLAEANRVHALSRGFHVWRTRESVVRGNTVTTPDYIELQTDGIYSQENRGNLYAGNDIVISNAEREGHDDGIQSYRDRDIVIAGNRIEQRNAKTGNAQGIFIVDAGGEMVAANNLVIGLSTRNSLLTLLNQSGTDGRLLAYNNTLVGSRWGVVQLQDAPDSEVKNNILASSQEEAAGITLDGGKPRAGAIDGNLYAIPHGSPGYDTDRVRLDWDAWQALGYEAHGLQGEPGFRNAAQGDYALAADSAAIGRGLPCLRVEVDIAGLPRRDAARCTIGAYTGTAGMRP
ncbi:MAG: right-handed parallel beta-helix repeat-containing protein [Geminicoccaceae bacterium]